MNLIRTLNKYEFIELCLQYQQEKKIRKQRVKEKEITEYSMNNHFRIERKVRNSRDIR